MKNAEVSVTLSPVMAHMCDQLVTHLRQIQPDVPWSRAQVLRTALRLIWEDEIGAESDGL